MTDENKVYEAIEGARSSGKISKGANEATKAIERGTAKLVVVAKDVTPPEVVMHIPLLSKEKGIACVEVKSKEELGAAAGLSIPTAAVAITKEGDAAAIVKEVVDANKPEAPAEEKKEAPKTEEKPAEVAKEAKPEEKKEEAPEEEEKPAKETKEEKAEEKKE